MGTGSVGADMNDAEFYTADLAYIHDTGFGDFARLSAPGLLRILAAAGINSGLMVDLGCGSGIWARTLVDSGYQVEGVEISAGMIAIARQRVPEAAFHLGSFSDFPIPACRAVTALGEVFNYLFDPTNSLTALRVICQRVFDALGSGGIFIFDAAEPARCRGAKQAFKEGPDWTCLVEYQHDVPAQQLTRRIVTFRKFGDAYRRHEETHRQQLFEHQAVAGMLRAIGFQVRIVPGFGQFLFPAGVAGFIATQPN